MPMNPPSSTIQGRSTRKSPGAPVVPAWIGPLALGTFVAALFWRAWLARNAPFVPLDWAFQTTAEVHAWLWKLLSHELMLFVLAFVLGVLTPLGLAEAARKWAGRFRIYAWLTWLVADCIVMALCLAVAWNEWPTPESLILPAIFALAGIYFGAAALGGIRKLAWSFVPAGIAGGVLIGAVMLLGRLSVSEAPLAFEPNVLNMSEKRAMAARIRDSRPPPGEPRSVRLADHEIDGLVNSALGRIRGGHKARLHFAPSESWIELSLAGPARWDRRFLNVRLAGDFFIDNGHFHIGLHQLRLGRFDVPPPALRLVAGMLHGMVMDDPQLHRIMGAMEAVRIEPGALELVFEPGAIGRQVIPSLVQLLWQRPDVAVETGLYLRQLLQTASDLPPDADGFGRLMEEAFRLARQRSPSRDPRLENRAAIFALAIMLGHEGLEPLVGEILDEAMRSRIRSTMGSVTLRGRRDWPRHFLVSAALKLLSNEPMSDRVGLFKEQIDSKQGGSGFSFADLLANMAGLRFAVGAITSEEGARRLQSTLAQGFQVDDFFPEAKDLPEGIPAPLFQKKYGGVGGPGYHRMVEEIQRRLDSLPAIAGGFPPAS
ncbi:MAG: hypothetical protein LUO80_05120 [Methylococcaceae bacterium]|nr:hypothetical protein [Methylococcaceae bacterium]